MKTKSVFHLIIFYFFSGTCLAQTQTVGLFQNNPASFNGYTLFAPMVSKNTYLINNSGQLVHKWTSEKTPVGLVYLLENGMLLRAEALENNFFIAGGSGGKVKLLDWESKVKWSYTYSSETYQLHHDVKMLPNGNLLMIVWEKKSVAQAIAAGRKPTMLADNEIWPDHLIEVKPTDSVSGEIVWKWHAWDHLIQDFDSSKQNYGKVEDHPELININFDGAQGTPTSWNHGNALDYNQELDQILISVTAFKEIWILDHSTTMTQAAGHTGGRYGKGGDLLYRWGNQRTYNKGTIADQKLFAVHDAKWVKAGCRGEGNILMFNNGQARPDGKYSSVEEIKPPVDSKGNYLLDTSGVYGPTKALWTYTAQPATSMFSVNVSNATRMPNGNTLICYGPKGTFFELDSNNLQVWKYINPVTSTGPIAQFQTMASEANIVSKICRYETKFAGLAGRDLTPVGFIELPPLNVNKTNSIPQQFELNQNYPNPFNPKTSIRYSLPNNCHVILTIYNSLGQIIQELVNGEKVSGSYEVQFDGSKLASGVYFYSIKASSSDGTKNFNSAKKLILIK